jgi:hypothetical protein
MLWDRAIVTRIFIGSLRRVLPLATLLAAQALGSQMRESLTRKPDFFREHLQYVERQ